MKEFLWPVRVYYEDTDSGGVVYYANYLKFMERARTEWLRSLGFEQDRLLAEQGVLFAVRRVTLDLVRPARFNDRLQVSATIEQRRRASLTFSQRVERLPDAELLCRGEVQIACVDAARFRPAPIPPAVIKGIPDGI
ncbi:MAG TPA: tol-pal system-associated acyl-CoA thioesterase [Sedimenticola sp.]|nr:tol-pal system-associated acyl-CoA thioesterase [Sedimenticola sp.]